MGKKKEEDMCYSTKLTKKEEDMCYKLAQEIDNYDEEKDGCHWGHIFELVCKTYFKGKKEGQKVTAKPSQ